MVVIYSVVTVFLVLFAILTMASVIGGSARA